MSSSGEDQHSALVICSRKGSTLMSSTLEGRAWWCGGPESIGGRHLEQPGVRGRTFERKTQRQL